MKKSKNNKSRDIQSRVAGVKNIYMRNGVYYWQQRINGRRYHESLETANLETAKRRQKAKALAAKEGRWDTLLSSRSTRAYACMGEIYDAYMASLVRRSTPSPSTAKGYILAMDKILLRAGYGKPALVSAGELTPDLLDKYFAACAPDMEMGEDERNSRLRTISSCVTSARALFSRQSMQYYRHLTLPDLQEFLGYTVCSNPRIRYKFPVDQPWKEILHSGRTKLQANSPELYLVFLLVYDLGMRASEAVAARLSWIETVGGVDYMCIHRRPDEGYKPKGREGKVRIPRSVAADLRAMGHHPHILPGTHYNREHLVTRQFAAWMREQGWTRRECAHELRKLRGSFWQQKYGLDQAYNWLRHMQYQTTLDYYADMPIVPEPYAVDDDLSELVIRRVG